jgi:hypothetical protein
MSRLCKICGLFMALEGFMLVPSKFPVWLRWTYPVPFHTYVFQSLMFNEFTGDSLGSGVLISYEIEDTSIRQDLVVLLCYGLVSLWLRQKNSLYSLLRQLNLFLSSLLCKQIIHVLCMLKVVFGHTRQMKKRLKQA